MTENISRKCLTSISKKSYLSTIPESLINNSHYFDAANQQNLPENISKLTTNCSSDIQIEYPTTGPAFLSLRSTLLPRHFNQLSSGFNQENSNSPNLPND